MAQPKIRMECKTHSNCLCNCFFIFRNRVGSLPDTLDRENVL
ncbi:hypothetical protein D3A96_06610 [Robertkochia marina]|nr:hypothetical protein D3A96_06610 [Robertkochia marina]